MSPADTHSTQALYQLLRNEGLGEVYNVPSLQTDIGTPTPDKVTAFLQSLGYQVAQKNHGTLDDIRTALHNDQSVLVAWLEWGGQLDLVTDVFDDGQQKIGLANGGGTTVERFEAMWQYNRGSVTAPEIVSGLYLTIS